MRIAFVSRELYPLQGSGIGQFVSAAAALLSSVAEVTILTSSTQEPAYRRLSAEQDPRLPPPGVRVAFVEEPWPEEVGSYFSHLHLYSARAYERLRQLFPDRGPDLVEFADYHGEGAVTAQAVATADPFLERTTVCVRTHTSEEMGFVLNSYLPDDFPTTATFALERLALREADRVIWEGGDVAGTYRRFYGSDFLAPLVRIRYPFRGATIEPGDERDFAAGEPLRLLYLGRMERRKGVLNLVNAASGLDRADFRLTLIGGDTATAPLGVSMRDQLLLSVADDERIELLPPVPREELPELIGAHDAIVLPSLWECWPYTALEAMHLNRPVLATPVGGLAEMAVPGVSGWLARGSDVEELSEALESVLDDRAGLERMVRSGNPARRARSLTDEGEIIDAYRALGADGPARRRVVASPAAPPLVSAVVPYHASAEFIEETVQSLLSQTYPRLEIIVVNDGSFEPADWKLAELAASHPITVLSQQNAGLGAARNFGIGACHGRYVFPLDADDTAEPTFVGRCVGVLEARPVLSYVTSWSRYREEDGTPISGPVLGWQPLGSGYSLRANSERNVAGSATALIRRRVFDLGFAYSEELTSYEDWHFYRELERAGHRGAVIPERLISYRVHPRSMTRQLALANHARLEQEVEAHIRENSVKWTSLSA